LGSTPEATLSKAKAWGSAARKGGCALKRPSNTSKVLSLCRRYSGREQGRTFALKSVEKGGSDAEGCKVIDVWYEASARSRLKTPEDQLPCASASLRNAAGPSRLAAPGPRARRCEAFGPTGDKTECGRRGDAGPEALCTRPKSEFRAFSSSPPNAVPKARQMLCFSPARANSLLRTPSLAQRLCSPGNIGWRGQCDVAGLALCISFLC